MARARNIKPGFFSNDDLADCQPLARLLFIGLWCVADREGRMEDRPRRIRAEILPYDDCDIDALLDELQHHGFILRYEVGGEGFIQVLNFTKHQNPHMKEAKSTIPAPTDDEPVTGETEACDVLSKDQPEAGKDQAPEEHHTSTVQEPEKHNESPADSGFLIPDSLIPETLQPPCAPPARDDATASDELFAKFYRLYPNKKGKANALKAWKKLKLTDDLINQIFDGLGRYCVSADWLKDGGQFVPHPATWLNGRRWEDEVQPAGNLRSFPGQSRHTGFEQRDYESGLKRREDGTYGL
ncbi:MAG: phage replication protein [Pseudomonadota bacterium]|nr:phage replication protein [Pseudomonadota bacterium]